MIAPIVVGVVVTHRRRELLAQSLEVLSGQHRPLDHLIVVDNAAEPEVGELVAAQPIPTTYLPSRHNLGGAGGFALGMLHALALGADWVWCADDDGRPEGPEVLGTLLDCAQRHGLGQVSPVVVNIDDPDALAFPLRRGLVWRRRRSELFTDPAPGAKRAGGIDPAPGAKRAGGIDPAPGAKRAGGIDPAPGAKRAGGIDPAPGAKRAGGIDPAPGAKRAGGIDPAPGAKRAGGIDPAPGAKRAGGIDPAPGAKRAGGIDPAPGAKRAGGIDPAPGAKRAGGIDPAPGAKRAGGIDPAPDDFLPGIASLMNGALFAASTLDAVGVPDLRLFVRGDEVEMHRRLARSGIPFGTCLTTAYVHPDGSAEFRPILGGRMHTQYPDNDVKRFFTYRNRGYLMSQPGMRRLLPQEYARFGWYFLVQQRDPAGFREWMRLRGLGRAEHFGPPPEAP